MNVPEKLQQKLEERKKNNALRRLTLPTKSLIDFSSNDYLGLSKSEVIFMNTHQFLVAEKCISNGATGSRLLSGNHNLYDITENYLAEIHESEAALIFNSGYDANLGFFSSVPQRGDIILYDELSHASIRDGIQLSNAKAYKFKHNKLDDLKRLLARFTKDETVFVVTESVFSMDGDSPDLRKMAELCKQFSAYFIVDEAHALGVFGKGLVQEINLVKSIFARIITFGKGLGCHGAVILGNTTLKEYLVNFARSFIYTTGLPTHSLATIKVAYEYLLAEDGAKEQEKLRNNIQFFKAEIKRLQLDFITSDSAIHCCVISGNEKVKTLANSLQEKGFDVKPILSPTVARGEERLRFCLHSFNTRKEITEVLQEIKKHI